MTAHVNFSPGQSLALGLIIFAPAIVAFVFVVVGLLKLGKGEACKNWFVAAAVSAGIQVIWLMMLNRRF